LWRHEATRHGQSLISHGIAAFLALNLVEQFFSSFSRQKIIQISYMVLKKDCGNLAVRLLYISTIFCSNADILLRYKMTREVNKTRMAASLRTGTSFQGYKVLEKKIRREQQIRFFLK
jgi:hypothetical protein